MLTVHKYPVPWGTHFAVDLPVHAQVLEVAMQNGRPQLWALVDTEREIEFRQFRLVGTGHPIEENIGQLRFVSTFQAEGGSLVFHVFEVLRDASKDRLN